MVSADLIINTDGGSRGNPGLAASAFVVRDAKNVKLYSESESIGYSTNNIAEHTAVLLAMKWLQQKYLGPAKLVEFRIDSELVVNQLTGRYKIKSPGLATIIKQTKELEVNSKYTLNFIHIPREENHEADALVNIELDK